MDNRIAIIGIIVENLDLSVQINDILHQYSQYIIGRTKPLARWHPKS